MAIFLISLGIAVLILGFIGCVVPVLPGPPLAYAALLLVSAARKWEAVPRRSLIIMAILAAVVTVLDYLLPVLFARKSGASKGATVGSVLGMVAGIFLFPPFGVIVGALVGAIVGELVFNPSAEKPLKVGIWVFLGTILAMVAKLAYTGVAAGMFIRGIRG